MFIAQIGLLKPVIFFLEMTIRDSSDSDGLPDQMADRG